MSRAAGATCCGGARDIAARRGTFAQRPLAPRASYSCRALTLSTCHPHVALAWHHAWRGSLTPDKTLAWRRHFIAPGAVRVTHALRARSTTGVSTARTLRSVAHAFHARCSLSRTAHAAHRSNTRFWGDTCGAYARRSYARRSSSVVPLLLVVSTMYTITAVRKKFYLYYLLFGRTMGWGRMKQALDKMDGHGSVLYGCFIYFWHLACMAWLAGWHFCETSHWVGQMGTGKSFLCFWQWDRDRDRTGDIPA